MEKPAVKFLKVDELAFLILWCSGYIGAKLGVPLSGTFTLLFFRYSIVIVLVGIYITLKNQWEKPNKHTLTMGFFAHFVWLTMILTAFEYGINAGSAALIAAMQPILTALIAPKILKERNNLLQWAGITLGFIGVFVFVSGDSLFTGTALWVYGLPLIATISLTSITVCERKKTSNQSEKEIPIMTSLFWQALLTCALLFPLAMFYENFYAEWSETFIFSVIWLAVVVSICAYGMMFYLIRTRNATRVSSLQYFVPATTMFIAYIVFQEKVNMIGIIGLLITTVGFICLHKGESIK